MIDLLIVLDIVSLIMIPKMDVAHLLREATPKTTSASDGLCSEKAETTIGCATQRTRKLAPKKTESRTRSSTLLNKVEWLSLRVFPPSWKSAATINSWMLSHVLPLTMKLVKLKRNLVYRVFEASCHWLAAPLPMKSGFSRRRCPCSGKAGASHCTSDILGHTEWHTPPDSRSGSTYCNGLPALQVFLKANQSLFSSSILV